MALPNQTNTSFLEKAQDFILAQSEKTIASHDANSKKFQTDGMPVQKAFKTVRENLNVKNLKRVAMGAFAIGAVNSAFNVAPAQANSSENKIQPTLEQVIIAEAGKDGSQVKYGGVLAGIEAVTKDDGKFSLNEIATFIETRNKTNGFIDSKKDQADTSAIINNVNAGENIIKAASEVVFTSPEAKIQDEKNKKVGKVTEGQYYAQIVANAQKSILEKQNQKPTEVKPTTKTSPQTPANPNIDKKVFDDLSFNTNISTPKDQNSLEIIANAAGNVIGTIDRAITPGANAAEVKDVQKIMSNDKLPTLSSKYDEMITPQMEKYTSENKVLQTQLKKDLKFLNNLNGRYQEAKKLIGKSQNEASRANLKVLETNAKNQYVQVAKTLTQLENISSNAEAKSNLEDNLKTLFGAIGGAAAMATIWGIYERKKNKQKQEPQVPQKGTIVPPGKFGPENSEVEREFIANPNQYKQPIGPEELKTTLNDEQKQKLTDINSQLKKALSNNDLGVFRVLMQTKIDLFDKINTPVGKTITKKGLNYITPEFFEKLRNERNKPLPTVIKPQGDKPVPLRNSQIYPDKNNIPQMNPPDLSFKIDANQYKPPIGPEPLKTTEIAAFKPEPQKKGVATKMEDGFMNLFPGLRKVKDSLIQTRSEIIAKPVLSQEETPETLKPKSYEEMTQNELASEIIKMGSTSEYYKKRIDLELVKFFNNDKKVNGSTATELSEREFFYQVPYYISSLQIKGAFNQDTVYEIFEIARDNLISLIEPSKPVTINLDQLKAQKPAQPKPETVSSQTEPDKQPTQKVEIPPAPLTAEQIQQNKIDEIIDFIKNSTSPSEEYDRITKLGLFNDDELIDIAFSI